MDLEKRSDAKSVSEGREMVIENPQTDADNLTKMASKSLFGSEKRQNTIGEADQGSTIRDNSESGRQAHSQAPGQQNPIENITRIYLHYLETDQLVKDIIVDSSSIDKGYTLFVVIDEESLDVRMDVMGVTQNIREIHPTWDITAHIIAEETDPNLDQIPKSAIAANKLLDQKSSPELGYAF
jgi:hypothetical protein